MITEDTPENGFPNPNDPEFNDKCPCYMKFNPMCAKNGVTYMNLCVLKNCAKLEKISDGPCNDPSYTQPDNAPECICSVNFSPACSVSGVTYQNQCVLACSADTFKSPGSCLNECGCTNSRDPVCGEDGVTYGNMCKLECANVALKNEGECQSGGSPQCEHCRN